MQDNFIFYYGDTFEEKTIAAYAYWLTRKYLGVNRDNIYTIHVDVDTPPAPILDLSNTCVFSTNTTITSKLEYPNVETILSPDDVYLLFQGLWADQMKDHMYPEILNGISIPRVFRLHNRDHFTTTAGDIRPGVRSVWNNIVQLLKLAEDDMARFMMCLDEVLKYIDAPYESANDKWYNASADEVKDALSDYPITPLLEAYREISLKIKEGKETQAENIIHEAILNDPSKIVPIALTPADIYACEQIVIEIYEMIKYDDPTRWLSEDRFAQHVSYFRVFTVGAGLHNTDVDGSFWFKLFNESQPLQSPTPTPAETITALTGMKEEENNNTEDVVVLPDGTKIDSEGEVVAAPKKELEEITISPPKTKIVNLEFTNQVYQSGASIIDYTHRIEQLRTRHCGYPITLNINGRDLVIYVLNSTYENVEMLDTWTPDDHDGYLTYIDIAKDQVLLNMVLTVDKNVTMDIEDWASVIANETPNRYVSGSTQVLSDTKDKVNITLIVSSDTWRFIKDESTIIPHKESVDNMLLKDKY